MKGGERGWWRGGGGGARGWWGGGEGAELRGVGVDNEEEKDTPVSPCETG